MIPYAINNLYGDPAIQIKDSLRRLSELSQDPWAGPVAIITKGFYTPNMVQQIKNVAPKKLVVLVSISALETGSEPVSVANRLQSISNFSKVGIPVIGYARPLTSPNAGELINKMYDSGADTVIVSGFRGTKELGLEVDISNPSLRVKEISKIAQDSVESCGKKVFSRTSCGVAYALGLKRSWNPYWKSPQLAGCETCPLKRTCFKTPNVVPYSQGLRVLEKLGYVLEETPIYNEPRCNVQPWNRRQCTSCCTTCFVHKSGAIKLLRKDTKIPNLGEVSFARHILGGVQVYSPGVIDGGDPSVGDVNPPRRIGPFASNKRVRALNTWMSYSTQINKCYGCKYCFAPYYSNELGDYGCLPSEIMEIGQ